MKFVLILIFSIFIAFHSFGYHLYKQKKYIDSLVIERFQFNSFVVKAKNCTVSFDLPKNISLINSEEHMSAFIKKSSFCKSLKNNDYYFSNSLVISDTIPEILVTFSSKSIDYNNELNNPNEYNYLSYINSFDLFQNLILTTAVQCYGNIPTLLRINNSINLKPYEKEMNCSLNVHSIIHTLLYDSIKRKTTYLSSIDCYIHHSLSVNIQIFCTNISPFHKQLVRKIARSIRLER